MKAKTTLPKLKVRILQLSSPAPINAEEASYRTEADIAVVFFPASEFGLAKQYWQHSGEGVSSREAEYFLSEMKSRLTSGKKHRKNDAADPRKPSPHPYNSARSSRSSRSSGRRSTINAPITNNQEFVSFIEERFGRSLDLSFAKEAKKLLSERIASQVDPAYTSSDLVYLYPTGMASIFNAHQVLLHALSSRKDLKSVCFGFPYVDTLNILKKWGAGVHFYGFGDEESLDALEKRLEGGEKIIALFCECPTNPMLTTPNLKRIHELAVKYDFAVVVDDTVGNPSNIEVIPYADFVASSLTKVFSGDSNVMAGSLVLNKQSRYYPIFKKYMDEHYENNFWDQDAIFLERNSRDFVRRSRVMNDNALAVLKLFEESPLIDKIFYPAVAPSKANYDAVKKPEGGYGGLMSIIFNDPTDAVCFFNTVRLSKGPSLGTNFTLVCPYAILAHYQELDKVAKWGVDRNLVRLSIGMEPQSQLIGLLKEALDSAQEQHDL